MELSIQKNNYAQPTEVRIEVVQGICDAFLSGCVRSIFHPYAGANNGCRRATKYIIRHKGEEKYWGFCDGDIFSHHEGIKINGVEMKMAFKALIDAGYYIFKVYKYGSWMGYKVSCKPFMDGGVQVYEFNDFID